MTSTLKELVSVLRDPELPFSDVSAILATLSGRMRSKLEDAVCQAMDVIRVKAGVQEFPAVRIKKPLNSYMATSIQTKDRPMFRTPLGPLFDAAEKYEATRSRHSRRSVRTLRAD